MNEYFIKDTLKRVKNLDYVARVRHLKTSLKLDIEKSLEQGIEAIEKYNELVKKYEKSDII